MVAVIYGALRIVFDLSEACFPWATTREVRMRVTWQARFSWGNNRRKSKELSLMFVTRNDHVTTAHWHIVGFVWSVYYVVIANTLRPRQNCCLFADTFKRIFLKENVRISIKISLKFVPKSPIDNIPALFQIMAWHQPGDKPLSEAVMVSLLMHICVARPQHNSVSIDICVQTCSCICIMLHKIMCQVPGAIFSNHIKYMGHQFIQQYMKVFITIAIVIIIVIVVVIISIIIIITSSSLSSSSSSSSPSSSSFMCWNISPV